MKYQALLPATEEIRECCSLLTEEMLHWPGVKMYHLFGTCAFYHRKVMFALLPDKRTLDGANAISFKTSITHDGDDSRENWHSFELANRGMVSAALASLEEAYRDSKSLAFSAPPIAVGG